MQAFRYFLDSPVSSRGLNVCRHLCGTAHVQASPQNPVNSESNLIESDQDAVRIDRGNESGFVVNNVHVNGSIVAYGSVWMMWRVTTPQDVTPDSLALLNVTKPVPDLLVFGSGAIRQQPPAATLQMLRTHNIGLEALPTSQAIQYFNLLNQERRSVACAMLPDA